MGKPPLIGITTYVTPARWGDWEASAALVPSVYVDAVEDTGARAVLLPPSGRGAHVLVDRLDALVISGGPDVDPARYGAARDPRTEPAHPERDEGEFTLLRAALDTGLPVLGLCRGMQLLAVATGGVLIQHLPDAVGHEGHRDGPSAFGIHDVHPVPGTRLHGILGDAVTVKSLHHQGVGAVGEGVTVAAYAADGSIEAVELPGDRFVLGVLWHPEEGDDPRLFEALTDAADRAADRRDRTPVA